MDINEILVVLFGLFCELAARSCPRSHYERSGTCCQKCMPGTFVFAHCNKTTGTVCKPCKDGTFTNEWTSLENCRICSRRHCSPTMSLVQVCNATVDNRCGCAQPSQFHYLPLDSCRECTSCPPGQYPLSPCTGYTICSSCPKNHFSNVSKNYNQRCQKCTRCKKYRKKCSAVEDSICRYDIFTKKISTTLQPKILVESTSTPTILGKWNSTVSLSKKTPNKFVDPIIIAVVCVIIVITIIIIAAVLYLKRKQRALSNECLSQQPMIRETTFSFGGALLRNQSGEIILGLHALLNPEDRNDWRAVASELGVPYNQIRNFEASRNTAAKEMLHYWSTAKDATLDRLYQALSKLNRDDACTFLEEKVNLESVETTV